MSARTPFHSWIQEYLQWYEKGRQIGLGGHEPPARPSIRSDAGKVLIFSPHPDDEVIVGALPVRLMREQGRPVYDVAVTLGSKKERQLPRLEELKNCCRYIGYELIQTAERGLEGVNLKTRSGDPDRWGQYVDRIVQILTEQQPAIVFFPHEKDANSTHIGVHYLVMDALGRMPLDFECLTVETEYWAPIESPNLMVEVSPELLADLIAALTFHVGEVERNPYHLSLPAWMADNVRRGSELVGGQGAAAVDYRFATLYRVRRWRHGTFQVAVEQGTFLSQSDDLGKVFPL